MVMRRRTGCSDRCAGISTMNLVLLTSDPPDRKVMPERACQTAVSRRLAVVALALTSGCRPGPTGMPDVAPVAGVVTLDGKPLSSALVVFLSANGRSAMGPTDDAGAYKLRYLADVWGAEIGLNEVRIETRTDAPPSASYRDPIPTRYNSASELKVTVVPGRNTFNFDLLTKK